MSSHRLHTLRPWEVAVYALEKAIKAFVIAFLLLPAVMIIILSFSNDENLAFPPNDWGLGQYESLFGSDYWMSAVGMSFVIAIPTALLCAVVGVPAALALERSRMRGKGPLWALGVAPLVLPGVAYAVALYTFYIDARLIGTIPGVVLAEAMLAMPFVIIIVAAGLRRIPRELELVAMSLGASTMRATWGITLRLLAPSIAASTLLAFMVAFDEAVLVTFLGGGEIITLPKATYDSVRDGLDPVITAIASLLMVFTGALMALTTKLRGEGEQPWAS
ncbi:MAG TPA: ABC transporter permease [Solirubrobacteraceae bacterium]|nr:ABC transporter permease [Solirubrobacteraceae bacterium]